MDMKITKFLILLSVSGPVLGLFPSDPSNLLSAQVKKSCFLTFHPPPKLHFHEVPAKADRFSLLTLGNPVSQSVDVVIVEGNSTTEVSEFPLTSYNDEETVPASDETTDAQDFLPPADPFTDFEMDSAGVDSTDQLMQLFENLEKSGNPSSRVSVNFIPPFSTDSGNFKIESRASYTRRVRQ